jgi:hypothetical protein
MNQLLDPRRLLGLPERRKAPAGLADDLIYEFSRGGMRVAKPIIEVA